MKHQGKSALFIAGVAAMTLISAPVAGAERVCQATGVATTTCQTNGSVSIKSRPSTTAPPAARPVIPWLGVPGT